MLPVVTVQPEVLEMDGELALHLAWKSVMMPLLPRSWSRHSICVAALQVIIIAEHLHHSSE